MSVITPTLLKRVSPRARARIINPSAVVLEKWTEKLDIRSTLRLSHFLAQLAHESDGFRTTIEYASGDAYEGREDLGNALPGDGRRYRGRGLIQCTGRSNYRRFTEWMRTHNPDAPDFVEQPSLVAEHPWATLSALWYWSVNNINDLADRDDLRAVTKRINGGYNGIGERSRYLTRAKVALEVADKKPPEAPPVAQSSARMQIGDVGDHVRELQRNLNTLGFRPRLLEDGRFGGRTKSAVERFQAKYGLKEDGVVGPITAATLVQALSA